MKDPFDLSKLKESVGGLINNVRSMVTNPEQSITPNPDDALGAKLADISRCLEELAQLQKAQIKLLSLMTQNIHGAFNDIEALRHQVKIKTESSQDASTDKATEGNSEGSDHHS